MKVVDEIASLDASFMAAFIRHHIESADSPLQCVPLHASGNIPAYFSKLVDAK